MAVVISKSNWRSPARRLYLWECGTCHSKSLARYGEFCNYEFQCPVCGKITKEVDPDYICSGGILSLHVTKSATIDGDDYHHPIPMRILRITDNDYQVYSYSYRETDQPDLVKELDELDRWFNAENEL